MVGGLDLEGERERDWGIKLGKLLGTFEDLEGEREGNWEGIMDMLGIKLGKLLGTLVDFEGERVVAVVGGAVGGGHPIFPPPASLNILLVAMGLTSQHSSWLNDLA